MVNLLLTTILIGAAVSYALEFLDAISMGLLDKITINKIFSIPFSTIGVWLMQQSWSIEMFVTVPAATFVSLALLKFINKPTQVQYQRVPRI